MSSTTQNASSMASTVAVSSLASVAPARTDTVFLTPSAPSVTVNLPISMKFDKATPALSYAPYRASLILAKFGMFESVRLVSASFTLTIPPALGSHAFYCFSTSATAPTSHFMAQPIAAFVGGGQYGYTETNFVLPPDSAFGRELKMATLGNPPPVLHVKMVGLDTFEGFLRGVLTLECSGLGVVDGVLPSGASSALSPDSVVAASAKGAAL